MNKARREELIDVAEILDEAIQRLEEFRDEEQDSLDSFLESLQDSIRGQAMQEAIDTLDEFGDSISRAIF